MRTLRVALLSMLALAAAAPEARADDVMTAKEHYERGTTLYDLQKYAEAAEEYEKAYQAKRDPALLYNLGQAYRLANNPTKAIGAYKSFLRRMPNNPRRAEVEARIKEMQELEEEQRRNPPKPAEPAPAPVAAPVIAPTPVQLTPTVVAQPFDEAKWKKIRLGGIVTGALGIGILGAGIGLQVVANQKFNQLDNPMPGTLFDPGVQSDMKTYRGLGVSFLTIGAVATVTGIGLFAIAHRKIVVARRAK